MRIAIKRIELVIICPTRIRLCLDRHDVFLILNKLFFLRIYILTRVHLKTVKRLEFERSITFNANGINTNENCIGVNFKRYRI